MTSPQQRIASKAFGQASSKSNDAKVKMAASTSRPHPRPHSLHVTPANKDTSTAKRTASSTYKGARPKLVNNAKEQQRPGQQSDVMARETEVVFLKGDITELKVDVIVCPAGPKLITATGIAKEVVEKAGSGLKHMFAEKRKEGPLPTGHTFVSGSFNLPYCKHIIYVVVPKWSENEAPGRCRTALEDAFSNCFQELRKVQSRAPAEKGKVETLAMPALGAGTNKIPKTVVAEVMCDAVKKFLAKRNILAPHLKKIMLVSLDREMLMLLQRKWDSAAGPVRSTDAESDGRVSWKKPVGGRSGATNDIRYDSHSKGSQSTSGSKWFGFSPTDSLDKFVHPGLRHDQLHSHDALVARGGGTSNDKHNQHYQQTGKRDLSKEQDYLANKCGGTSLYTDSDSDRKNGAYGGAYGPGSGEVYPLSGKLTQSRKVVPLSSTNGQASDNTDSDSDNGNGASGSGNGCRNVVHHESPFSKIGCADVTMNSEKVSRNYTTSFKSVLTHRQIRPVSPDDDSDGEDVGTTLKGTKALTLKDVETCPICFDPIGGSDSESLPMCGHRVCKDCWKELKLHNPICPVCRKVYGELRGNQPEKAKMTVKFDQHLHLPGYELSGTIVIDYVVPDGRQTEEHPNPGRPYKGTKRRGFLPDNKEGRAVLRLLEKAFKARLIFTIGRSVTSGTEDVVTWNDIHHKTNISGPEFGYPDATYLTRVKEELAAKGIR